jgi:hypothetical protein
MNEHEHPSTSTNGLYWRAEVFLEDSSGHRTDEDDAEFPGERDARAWIRTILESLRWTGRELGQDESFCYLAELTELPEQLPVATAYLFAPYEPIEWWEETGLPDNNGDSGATTYPNQPPSP